MGSALQALIQFEGDLPEEKWDTDSLSYLLTPGITRSGQTLRKRLDSNSWTTLDGQRLKIAEMDPLHAAVAMTLVRQKYGAPMDSTRVMRKLIARSEVGHT